MNNLSISNLNFKSLFSINNSANPPKTNRLGYKQNSDTNTYLPYQVYSKNTVRTVLSGNDEIEKYNTLLNCLRDCSPTETSFNQTPIQQTDMLLKSGKLLSKSKDGTTMLDNLYQIATIPREQGLNQTNLICNILDNTLNPRIITQTLGDVPDEKLNEILSQLPENDPIRKKPSDIEVASSGTCPAASNEFNLADKNPAEYARWVNHLSSKEKSIELVVDLSAISQNKLDALMIMNMLDANVEEFGFDKTKVKISLDDHAFIRAKLQDENWNTGERNVADVLVQSAIMQAGSQNTYDSLTDMRGGSFSSNPKGLIEMEKTFVESLIKNEEITSLVYQQIDDEQNLIGHTCSFDKMKKHIKDTIDSGDNVIIGYVLTNETVGKVASGLYNPETDGPANRVINGHEITIVNYRIDENGKMIFICVDTDDDSPEFVEYSEDWLLPKIHHAGYPAHIVADDEKEIMKKANMI